MQALNTAGGQDFVGVNFGAMDKYRKSLSAEQWKTCAKSLKVPSSYTLCVPIPMASQGSRFVTVPLRACFGTLTIV